MHQTSLNLVIQHKRECFQDVMFQEMSNMYDKKLVEWHQFGILNFNSRCSKRIQQLHYHE
jgi:hypothetical protein